MSWTLEHAITRAYAVAWSNTKWGQTALKNAESLAAFVGPGTPLDEITLITLDAWADKLHADGASSATINRYLAAVSKVFTVAIERDGVTQKPRMPRRKETKGRVRYLSQAEEIVMIHHLPTGSTPLFALLIDTGLRMGEALSLRPDDVDLATNMVTAWTTKNGHPRSVPMTRRVRAAAEAWLAITPKGTHLRERTLVPITRQAFRRDWDAVRTMMGLKNDSQFVPHSLRHTCASRLIQRGVHIRVVQEWMGHKSLAMTMRYAHLAPSSLADAVAVLEGSP